MSLAWNSFAAPPILTNRSLECWNTLITAPVSSWRHEKSQVHSQTDFIIRSYCKEAEWGNINVKENNYYKKIL